MKLVDESNLEKYNEFLKKHDRCNFQQSIEWVKVKAPAWKNEIVLAEDKDGNIIGSISVLIRKIPIFGNLMYSSRGPVCDIHNKEVLEQLTNGLKELAKKYNAFVLKIEPDIKSDDQEFRKIVTELKYKIKDDAKNFSEEIQPRYVFRLDIKGKTEDEIFNNINDKFLVEKIIKYKKKFKIDFKLFDNLMKMTPMKFDKKIDKVDDITIDLNIYVLRGD